MKRIFNRSLNNIHKEKFKIIWDRLFLLFLIIYTIVTITHVFEFQKVWYVYLLFIFGLILARFAHIRKNYITVILLLIHMSIEWFEWSQSGMNLREGIWNALHVIMDFVFLFHELSVHTKKNRYKFLSFSIIFLMILFFLGHSIIPKENLLLKVTEPFVIGGILGCVLSHLYYHLLANFNLGDEHKHWHK